MRRVPLFVRSAVICSSATLLIGFVALKGGVFEPASSDADHDEVPVRMAGTKNANLGLALENRIDNSNDLKNKDLLRGNGAGVKVPPELKGEPSSVERYFRAPSSKSMVPAVDPGAIQIPVDVVEKATRKDQMRAFGSKSSVPLIEPGKVQFPAKQATESPAEKGPEKPMLMPSTKRAPVFDFTPSESTAAPPRTMLPGSKSAPAFDFKPKAEGKSAPPPPPPPTQKVAPQTFSKGSKGKGG